MQILDTLNRLNSQQLWDFWRKHRRGRRYLELFPSGGPGSKKITASLANYASNLAVSRECRDRGDLMGANMYNSIAGRIIARLNKRV